MMASNIEAMQTGLGMKKTSALRAPTNKPLQLTRENNANGYVLRSISIQVSESMNWTSVPLGIPSPSPRAPNAFVQSQCAC